MYHVHFVYFDIFLGVLFDVSKYFVFIYHLCHQILVAVVDILSNC